MSDKGFVEILENERATAILRTSIEEAAAPAMRAAMRAGFRILEFTLTIPAALTRIAEFAALDAAVVGAGTVLTPRDAEAAVEAGAQFLVSPVVDEEVIAVAKRLGVAMMPGAQTPSEMWRAHRAGAPLQKLFPAPAIGPTWVRACLGPLPFLRIVPTTGVDSSNARAWLEAGAHAVGFVAPLFPPEALAAGRFDTIEQRGRALLASLKTPPPPSHTE